MKPVDFQIVKYNDLKATCNKCENDLTDVNNMTYLKKRWGEPKHWDELCECDNCKQKFFLRHEIFDKKGHIHSYIFTEDINNASYNWMNNLNDVQKLTIAKHFKRCEKCKKNLSEQICLNIELKVYFQNLRKR